MPSDVSVHPLDVTALPSAVLDELPGLFLLIDERGRLLRWNRHFQEVTGYTGAELTGRKAITLWSRRERDAVLAATRIAIETGESVCEAHLVTADGNELPLLLTGVSRRIGGRRLLMSFGTDISERRRREQQLRRLSEVFRQILDAVVILDHRGHVLAANEAYARLTGLDEDHDRPLERLLVPVGNASQPTPAELMRTASQDGIWTGEVDLRSADKTIRGQWLTMVGLPEPDGPSSVILVFHDITRLREVRERLHERTYYDALTRLPKRRRFRELLDMAVQRTDRSGYLLGVIVLDIQRFRDINNSLGAEEADQVLRTVAERLINTTRGADIVARIGANQFSVLAEPLKDHQDAYAQATRLLEAVQQPIPLRTQSVECSAAVGIALYPGDADHVDKLLQYADTAMHEAKEWGQNVIFFYSEQLTRRAVQRLKLAQALRDGLQLDWFRLHYQLQLALESQRVVGMESLVRFEHPESGLINPGEFIPVAEDSGLIQELGGWVLRTACRQARQWMDAGYPFGRVAVNISAQQIQDSSLPQAVANTLEENGLDPERLELEITESALVADADGNIPLATLHALREIGVRLVIDDFGTGYSSLMYLRQLPIDGLKIDKSFIQEIPEKVESRRIVETIITLAEHLGLDVVAEGIETDSELAFLAAYPHMIAQGFLWSRPLPADEVEQLFSAREAHAPNP